MKDYYLISVTSSKNYFTAAGHQLWVTKVSGEYSVSLQKQLAYKFETIPDESLHIDTPHWYSYDPKSIKVERYTFEL